MRRTSEAVQDSSSPLGPTEGPTEAPDPARRAAAAELVACLEACRSRLDQLNLPLAAAHVDMAVHALAGGPAASGRALDEGASTVYS